jgi:hypothetical protein
MSGAGGKVARKASLQIMATPTLEAIDVLYQRRGAMASPSHLYRAEFESHSVRKVLAAHRATQTVTTQKEYLSEVDNAATVAVQPKL